MAKKLEDILTHCETMAAFEENLSSGVITQDRLVLIKETKQLWSHGQFYDCSGGVSESYVDEAIASAITTTLNTEV